MGLKGERGLIAIGTFLNLYIKQIAHFSQLLVLLHYILCMTCCSRLYRDVRMRRLHFMVWLVAGYKRWVDEKLSFGMAHGYMYDPCHVTQFNIGEINTHDKHTISHLVYLSKNFKKKLSLDQLLVEIFFTQCVQTF